MRGALVFDKLISVHNVIRFRIVPNTEESKHFLDDIQLKKHMQKVPMKLNW
jgi:hypothetical protein